MAMVTSAIANDGVLMDPYVVSSVQSPDLTPLETHKPQVLSTPMTPGNAASLQKMMGVVVSQGTGTNAQIPGVEVGGKTGTAQSDPKRKPYAWFTSFAPLSDPDIAVAVIVEDADIPRNDIAGGRLAAPIARSVMQAGVTMRVVGRDPPRRPRVWVEGGGDAARQGGARRRGRGRGDDGDGRGPLRAG